jgi:glutamate/tyrosine decarboxylase-like PLP-dependent enzyme
MPRSLDISPTEFRRIAEKVTDIAADYLETLNSRPISPPIAGVVSEQLFREPIPERGLGDQALAKLADITANSRAQNGRFFGYVLGSGEPVAATADLLASVINQNVTAWRSGPAAVMVEKTVVSWLAEAVGCKGFQGSLTGGGSMANLMGLAMAREAKMAANEDGMQNRQPVIYCSDEIHMSIPKSVALLGLGRKNVRRIPVDAEFRINSAELERAIELDRSAGNTPIAIVASAGTVNTGAIDPLRHIAEIARHHQVWFHIDGAYGALAALAAPQKFAGLELADSISLDPHKWLYQPLDCGCLLYRDPEVARTTFAHTGDYAKTLSTDPIESFAFFEESLELSRRFRALKLWLSLRYHGMSAFRVAIQQNLDHAQQLAKLISQQPNLELMAPVSLSAVCFRYRSSSAKPELDSINQQILRRTHKRGHVYLSNATLRDQFCLRACIVNHRTTDADIEAVISEVLASAKDLGF